MSQQYCHALAELIILYNGHAVVNKQAQIEVNKHYYSDIIDMCIELKHDWVAGSGFLRLFRLGGISVYIVYKPFQFGFYEFLSITHRAR